MPSSLKDLRLGHENCGFVLFRLKTKFRLKMQALSLAVQSYPFLKGPNQGKMLKAKGLSDESHGRRCFGPHLQGLACSEA